MTVRTTLRQRRECYKRHRDGETYQAIVDSEGMSKWIVCYWYRRQRDGGGCETMYRRESTGLLGRFDPKVRYCVLRLRLEHPRWGPNRILARLKKHRSLRGFTLPSESSIGRYLHQWPRFRRRPKRKGVSERPNPPTQVH